MGSLYVSCSFPIHIVLKVLNSSVLQTIASLFSWLTLPCLPHPSCSEVSKVTLKSNGDEALNNEFLLKSNGDEVLNDGFPYKIIATKGLTLRKNRSDEAMKRLTQLKNWSDEAFNASSPHFIASSLSILYKSTQKSPNKQIKTFQDICKGKDDDVFSALLWKLRK